MSLEAALDEERREVIALLEGRGATSPRSQQRNPSPHVAGRAQSPANAVSPIRSMLDVGDTHTANFSHIKPSGRVKSPSSLGRARSPPLSARGRGLNPESAYKFEMMPTIEAHSMPKRVSQGGKKDKRSMSSVYGASSDLHSVTGTREKGSYGALLGKPSASPHQSRSQSPGGRKLNLMSDPNTYVTESGKVVDMNSAYRRLSDGAMLRSGGALASLPVRKGSDPAKGVTTGPDGEVRLAKDDFGDDSERAIQSSDDDDDDDDDSSGSSDDENLGPQDRRGRRRTRQDDGSEKHGAEVITAKSLLAAAEAERTPFCVSPSILSQLILQQAKKSRQTTKSAPFSNPPSPSRVPTANLKK